MLMDAATPEEVLKYFLSLPLDCSDKVFEPFLQLPNARYFCGNHPLARFVFVPGTRSDRVLLIAHTDTVWDRQYGKPGSHHTLIEKDGWLCGENPSVGIGADDRCGCAALWLLRNSGHSLLLVDGEEYRHWGAKYLLRSHRPLLRELNRHCYLVQLDLPDRFECSFAGVPVTKEFRRFVLEQGYRETAFRGGTDVRFLSRGRCGVNLSIGYRGQHTPKERVRIQDWIESCSRVNNMLLDPQESFSWSLPGFVRLQLLSWFRRGGKALKKIRKIIVQKTSPG